MACATAPGPSAPGTASWSAQDQADLRQMIDAAPPGQPTPLDLSNPVHERFYRKQLEMAGVTAEKYPQQFRVLKQFRRAEDKKTGILGVGPIQTFTTFGSDDGTHYASTALSSVPDQPYVSQLVLGLYDQDLNPIGTPQYEQQYNAGEDLQVEARGLKTEGVAVVAVGSYFWQDQYGTPHIGYMQAASSTAPTNITNTAPMPASGQTVTKLCLGRTGSDCTYTPEGGSGSNVLMPVIGSITFDSAIDLDPVIPNWSLITMAKPDAGEGGGCTIASTVDFFDPQYTQIDGDTITWNIDPDHFQPAAGCLKPNSLAIFTVSVGLTINDLSTFVTITSAPNTLPENSYYLSIPDLYVFFSCLAEGTEVTLADGGAKKIEALRPGERVLTRGDGTALAVDSKLKGTEEVPMVRLKTAAGHDLLLTDGHPVVTPGGVVLARMLAAGDEVIGREGPVALSAVTRESYGGFVWNLNVGPRQEDFEHLSDDTTFFANGILVGDNQMQFAHNRKHKYLPESVLDALPPEWHEDFHNYLAARAGSLRGGGEEKP